MFHRAVWQICGQWSAVVDYSEYYSASEEVMVNTVPFSGYSIAMDFVNMHPFKNIELYSFKSCSLQLSSKTVCQKRRVLKSGLF